MSDIAKMQEEFFELTDLEKEIEEKLLKETDSVEIKKLNRMLSAIANTIETTDLEIKHACRNQELEEFFQKRHIEGTDDAKDIWYEFNDMKAVEAADDAADEVSVFPEEPINSWEQ
jgi:hypothetical protein